MHNTIVVSAPYENCICTSDNLHHSGLHIFNLNTTHKLPYASTADYVMMLCHTI